ncbi:MAG: TetR/AcrR family transcriptional regulator [Gaiellales bacterium]
MTESPEHPIPARRSHALRNDGLLRDAAIRLIADRGWDALTANEVGPAAGLTHGAVYARFVDKRELGIALWTDALASELQSRLEAVMTSGLDADGEDAFVAAMDAFLRPASPLLAMLELLLAARDDDEIGAAVAPTANRLLSRWCRPTRTVSDIDATRAATIVYIALGFALASQLPWLDDLDATPAVRRLHRALATPEAPRPLPPTTYDAPHEALFDTGNPRLDGLLDATIACIGEKGYAASTLTQICRRANVSQGFVFSRYATKLDLFIAATEQMQPKGMEQTHAFVATVAEQHGIAVGEAVTWREYQTPALAMQRSVVHETLRLSRYDERMRELLHPKQVAFLSRLVTGSRGAKRAALLGEAHMDYALGHGIMMPCDLLPKLWQLPFDCVTTPLIATDPLAARRLASA